VQVFPPLEPATTYVLTARDLRNLLGIAGESRRTFTTGRTAPQPVEADTARPPATQPPPP
jgi:hypothetical protein